MGRFAADGNLITEALRDTQERISQLQAELTTLPADCKDYPSNRRSLEQAVAELRQIIETNAPIAK
jgi:uncharacterized protein (UPF0335 family)